METEDAIRAWLPLVLATVFIVLLSTIPMPIWLLAPTVLGMAYLIYVQVFHTQLLAKSFWLSTYLRSDSPIRLYLRRSVLLRWIAAIISLPLALLTYISVYGYGIWDCMAVCTAIFAAKRAHATISSPVDANVAEHLIELAHIRIYYWFAIFFVLAALALVSIAESFAIDYASITGDQIATQTIEEIKHPVRFIRHCSRTLRFSELQLLRVRDINGGPYGWLIYLFFLIPNALPAFGLVTLFAGLERLAHSAKVLE
jgi:hypothetical protein